MISLENLKSLIKQVETSGTYIRSNHKKSLIRTFYEDHWLPNSNHLLKTYGAENHKNLEQLFDALYSFTNRAYFLKTDVLKILRKIDKELDLLRIQHIKRGVEFKEDIKDKVLDLLKEKGCFDDVILNLKQAESFIKNDAKTSCGRSRESCEEFFRVIREKIENKEIAGGTLSQHVKELSKKKLISPVEARFYIHGLYAFLSEKGSHANKEPKEEKDAVFGFRLALITIDYILSKDIILYSKAL